MKAKKPIALFIGRFQPLHKGHLHAIKWIAKRNEKIIVVVGSSQLSHQLENPFTLKERLRMLRLALSQSSLLKKCKTAALSDIPENSKWASHLGKRVPSYDVFYSNNPLALRLIKRAGKKTSHIPFLRREDYQAALIRRKMKAGKEWGSRVPAKVRAYLKKIKAEERIRHL